jgi:peptidoglycan/LPS O-acetylase OafA/YrhL
MRESAIPSRTGVEVMPLGARASATGRHRLPYLDNLRAAMIAWVIAGHALLGYTAIGGWPYDEVHETTFATRTELILTTILGPTALFVIGTFFFLSGLVGHAAMERHGPARFAADRLARLGVPFVLFMALIWPMFTWFAYLAAGYHVSFWWEFTHRKPFLDSGPLWFAEVLLYVSLAYAAWHWIAERVERRPAGRSSPLGGWHLVGLAAGVALASFVVRLWFPARSTQILDLHLWQWPQCVGMFALGVVARRHGWHVRVPPQLFRACGWAIAFTLTAVPTVAIGAHITDVAADAGPFVGGWHWQALVLDGVEASLVVAGSVWLCGLAQRWLAGTGPRRAGWARASYTAFALQVPVLLTLSIALRPVPWPAEAKAVLVAMVGLPASFWLGRRLVRTRMRQAG